MSIIIDTPEGIAFYRLASYVSALSLEVDSGLRFSSRINVYSMAKREWGIKGNKARVLEQLRGIMQECQRGERSPFPPTN